MIANGKSGYIVNRDGKLSYAKSFKQRLSN